MWYGSLTYQGEEGSTGPTFQLNERIENFMFAIIYVNLATENSTTRSFCILPYGFYNTSIYNIMANEKSNYSIVRLTMIETEGRLNYISQSKYIKSVTGMIHR